MAWYEIPVVDFFVNRREQIGIKQGRNALKALAHVLCHQSIMNSDILLTLHELLKRVSNACRSARELYLAKKQRKLPNSLN
jgi:hypothetical protein